MSGALRVFNRQRTRPLDVRLFKQIVRNLLSQFPDVQEFDLALHLVNAPAMSRLNETHLGHEGATDVITLDYAPNGTSGALTGEIFICLDEAELQAMRFRSSWQSELVRYVVHGILHLRGHDDLRPTARRRMKREEARRLRELSRRFRLSKLARSRKLPA